MSDLIDRQEAIDAANDWLLDCLKVEKQDRSCGLIRRLEDLPSAQPMQPNAPNTLDAISREEAMKICRRMVWNGADDYLPLSAKNIENEIRKLPSIKVCETEPSDLISRQAATTIPILPKEHRKYQTMNIDDAYDLGWLDCQNCIEKLPSAQPELPIKRKCTVCPHCSDCDVNDDGTVKTAQPERKKGRWIKLYQRAYKCSECKSWWEETEINEIKEFTYCPKCGAKMEMEE